MKKPTATKYSFTQNSLVAFLLIGGCLSNIACDTDTNISDSPADFPDKTAALENEIRVLSKRNELQSERLAAMNAEIPGGLAMGEREKQLEQREVRLVTLEDELERLRVEANASTESLRQEAQNLSQERINFANRHRELLVQIGEAQQINERYDDIVREKENAILGERAANLRVDKAVRFVTFSCAVALLSCLIAFAYRARLTTERKRIETVVELTGYSALSNKSKKLGKGYDPYRFLRDFEE